MLTFRHVALLILAASVVLFLLAWTFSHGLLWYIILLVFMYLTVFIAGSFKICSQLYLRVHCKGKNVHKSIALSFDDGPHPMHTPGVLEVLRKHKVAAAFFVIGKNVEENKELLKKIDNDGHIIGNHTYSHSGTFSFYGAKKIIRELQENELIVEKTIGKRMALFRPPYGVTNPPIAIAARFLKYTVVGWSIRSLDTMGKNPEKTINRIVKRLKPGRVILMHDRMEDAPEILESIIEKALEMGYNFMPLDELLNVNAYRG